MNPHLLLGWAWLRPIAIAQRVAQCRKRPAYCCPRCWHGAARSSQPALPQVMPRQWPDWNMYYLGFMPKKGFVCSREGTHHFLRFLLQMVPKKTFLSKSCNLPSLQWKLNVILKPPAWLPRLGVKSENLLKTEWKPSEFPIPDEFPKLGEDLVKSPDFHQKKESIVLQETFFPTCQVRVVRFYVSCLVLLLLSSPPPLVVLLLSLSSSSSCSTATRDPQCSLSDLNHDHPRPVFPAGPQPRPSTPSVPCRTSTTTIHAQCSLPDLNHDHPRPVFPAGPQPRPSTPSVPCRTSTTTIPAQCSLPDLNHDHPRPVFPAGPQPRPSPPSVPCRTSTTTIHAQCSLPDLNREYPRQVFPAGPHVGRYGTKNVQKKVRKNVRQVCYILLAN